MGGEGRGPSRPRTRAAAIPAGSGGKMTYPDWLRWENWKPTKQAHYLLFKKY